MDHFQGVTAKERYDNELLNEARKTNELLEKLVDLLGHNAQMSNEQPIKTGRKRAGSEANTD